MIDGAGAAPDTQIAAIDPVRGIATVEKIAINAVMAGCRPEYMPVLIAAIQALTHPRFCLHGVQCTTNPVAPATIVNGPIRGLLGMNTSHGLLGPGNRANATIGRAIRLVLRNIGVDQSTHGSSSKYTFCFGEREEESPWEPLSVSQGLAPGQDAVTVVAVESVFNTTAVYWNANAIMVMLARAMRSGGTNTFFSTGSPTLVLCPGHARILADAGYDPKRIREELFERGRIPVSAFPPEGNIPMGNWTLDGDMVLIAERPEDILIVVAGGTEPTAQHSLYLVPFGLSNSVTRLIGSSPKGEGETQSAN
jgi:hypothetical protein